MAAASITLMVVAEDGGARSASEARLSHEPDCAIVDAVNPEHAFTAATRAQPDVIVWEVTGDPDAALPHLADLQELGIPVLALVHDDADGVRALAHGVSGVLDVTIAPANVVLAARAVAEGLVVLDPALAGIAGISHRAGAGEAPRGRLSLDHALVETLTPREHEVLRLMAKGLGNKQIAERLSITEHTAKFHVHTILGKLSTQSRTEAVVRAARLGLIAI